MRLVVTFCRRIPTQLAALRRAKTVSELLQGIEIERFPIAWNQRACKQLTEFFVFIFHFLSFF
ncbi:hypothetical protein ACMU_07105 [Actibacterium mucosum KCTC 23349]|uniref:Uncharacterized protein n=1 Tax=Actibacterium mucosum KCTC 23349 TaxID=1454373 RepID=A0A037ZMB8_9RHOB|nr:hypothetical protein ACMU_07105 [Actibacterium mucosum KCTC 23349]